MPLFWGSEPCRPPGCLSSRALIEFSDFPRTHQTLGCLSLVSPRVPPGEGEPRSKSDRGTKRGFPPRTKPPPPTQSPVLAGVLLTCDGAASPGSGSPWLRGPRASALGHASGSVPPGALRAAAAGRRSLGRCVTWAGSGRASHPRVTLYLRPAGSAGCRDKGTSRDLGLSEWSAKQPALAARSRAHCLSPA